MEKDLHSNCRVRELGQSLPAPTPDAHTPHTLHTHTTHLTHEHTALIVVHLFSAHAHRPPTRYTHVCMPCVYTHTHTLTINYIHPHNIHTHRPHTHIGTSAMTPLKHFVFKNCTLLKKSNTNTMVFHVHFFQM